MGRIGQGLKFSQGYYRHAPDCACCDPLGMEVHVLLLTPARESQGHNRQEGRMHFLQGSCSGAEDPNQLILISYIAS